MESLLCEYKIFTELMFARGPPRSGSDKHGGSEPTGGCRGGGRNIEMLIETAAAAVLEQPLLYRVDWIHVAVNWACVSVKHFSILCVRHLSEIWSWLTNEILSYGHKSDLCSHGDLWPFSPNVKKFPQDVPEILYSQERDGQTTQKHNASSCGCCQRGDINIWVEEGYT